MERQGAQDLVKAAIEEIIHSTDPASRVRRIRAFQDGYRSYIAIALDRAYYDTWLALGQGGAAEAAGVTVQTVRARAIRHMERFGLPQPHWQKQPPVDAFDARIWINDDPYAPRLGRIPRSLR